LPDMRITHRQIEAFRALMVSGSMTEAAQYLSVTQPAVSKIISQLESELGFSLFERRQGKLSPTDDGYILYAEVEQSFAGLERIKRAAKRIHDRTAGSLRLAVLPTFATGFIVHVARRLYQTVGGLQLSIQAYNSEEAVELVASGLCELGFAMTPVDARRVHVGPVMSVPSFCILPPGHRLQDRHEISVGDLAGETFIATAEGTSSRLRTDALFASMNISRRIQTEARWSLTISEFVQAGLGCSIVDGFTAASFADRGGLVRPLREKLDFTFVCITPRVASKSGTIRLFDEAFEIEFAAFQERLKALQHTP